MTNRSLSCYLQKAFICLISVFMMVGCSSGASSSTSSKDNVETEKQNEVSGSDETIDNQEPNEQENNSIEEEVIEEISDSDIDTMSNTQLKSIAMLNYLTVVSEQIIKSPNSRLYLEDVYHTLLNNLYPNAVDSKTQARVTDMVNGINSLRMITVKRERLAFIYEQNKANALAQAIPSPMALLSLVQSGNPLKMAASVLFMAVDSASSYSSAKNSVELSYLKDGWALDDEMEEELNYERVHAWNHMQEIVRENDLEGDLALNEEAVEDLVKWSNNDNPTRVIDYLEQNKERYKAYGGYWLLLAENYFKDNKYKHCIQAVDNYIKIQPRIFRVDVSLAKILPIAISSVSEVYSGADLIDKEVVYTNLLINNCNTDDWELRYFAALTYMDLYARTQNNDYLLEAYKLAKANVNTLIDEQLNSNTAYISEVKTTDTPSYATKTQKNDIKKYNEMLKKVRKTELPPVNNALLINVQLFLSLAEKLGYSEDSADTIDKMLHKKGENLFLTQTIDDKLWASDHSSELQKTGSFDGELLIVPANYLCGDSLITVTINSNGNETVIDDWKVKKVDRKGNDITNFKAELSSSKIKKIKYHDGDHVIVSIRPYGELLKEDDSSEKDYFQEMALKFTAKEKKIVVVSTYDFILVEE